MTEDTAYATTTSGRILIDTGATGNLITADFAETFIPRSAVISIQPDQNRGYRFANGQADVCSSQVTTRTVLGKVIFDVLETDIKTTQTPPGLLGMRTLQECDAMISIREGKLKTSTGEIPLRRGQNGHLYIRPEDFFLTTESEALTSEALITESEDADSH